MTKKILIFLLLCISVSLGQRDRYAGPIKIQAINFSQSSSRIITPSDDLSTEYAKLCSSAYDGVLGTLSATSRRTLVLMPGVYIDDLTMDTDYVDVIELTPGTAVIQGTLTITATDYKCAIKTQPQKDYLGPEYLSTIRKAQPVFSFVFDDGYTLTYTEALDYFTAKNCAFTADIITESVGDSTFMTWDQIRALQVAGCEIASHCTTHETWTIAGGKTKAQIDAMFYNSYMAIRNNTGIAPVSYVYVGGVNDLYSRGSCRRYYQCGITVGAGTTDNIAPIKQYELLRRDLDNCPDLATAQGYVDSAITNNAWCIFMVHARDDADWTNTKTYLSDLLDYIITTKGYTVDTVQQALAKVGNTLNTGDSTSMSNDFRIYANEDGEQSVRMPGRWKVLPDNTITAETVYTDPNFADGYQSYIQYCGASTAGAPTTVAGVLITHKYTTTSNSSYGMWQQWIDSSECITWRRRLAGNPVIWQPWEQDPLIVYSQDATITAQTVSACETITSGNISMGPPYLNSTDALLWSCTTEIEDGLLVQVYYVSAIYCKIKITNFRAADIEMAEHVFKIRAIR